MELSLFSCMDSCVCSSLIPWANTPWSSSIAGLGFTLATAVLRCVTFLLTSRQIRLPSTELKTGKQSFLTQWVRATLRPKQSSSFKFIPCFSYFAIWHRPWPSTNQQMSQNFLEGTYIYRRFPIVLSTYSSIFPPYLGLQSVRRNRFKFHSTFWL